MKGRNIEERLKIWIEVASNPNCKIARFSYAFMPFLPLILRICMALKNLSLFIDPVSLMYGVRILTGSHPP